MDTIVKVLNEKVADGDAKTIVEALKQIDPNAEGETVAEVLKNMEIGGGGGGASIKNPKLTITVNNTNANPVNITEFIQETDEILIPSTSYAPISIHRRTQTVVGYPSYDETGYFCTLHWSSSSLTYTSTLVNCTIEEGQGDDRYLSITDPTQEASAELVFTAV